MASSSVRLKPSRRRVRAAGASIALFLLAGCATPFVAERGVDYDPALLTGERLFGEPVALDELPAVPVAEPSPAMVAYVQSVVSDSPSTSRRFRELFAGLHRDGYFNAVYSAQRTLTAAETFESRGGNCLSYTNMFVALARAAGLDARYQVVDTPATWDADAGFLIRYTHINVVLRNVRMDEHPGDTVIIDFNDVHPDPVYPHREVSDAYAESLYYANHSVRLMREDKPRRSFAYLRRALETAPQNSDLWINLGAFYATQQDFASSVEAYEIARRINPRNKAAYSGLARSYASIGNEEMAAVYEEKVRNYRRRNPYYHYALAQYAFEASDYQGSLEHVERAIDLSRREPTFHLLKALVHQQLGDLDAAQESMEKARRFGLKRPAKLNLLRSLAGVTAS